MELSKVRPNQALTQHVEPSKKSKVVALLAKLGVRRQAKLATEDYLVFAEDLMPYELTDIQSGLESLSSRPRNEGETAFPESAAVIAEVKYARRDRKAAEERERRIADEAAERRRRETHPEEYIASDEIKEMAARIGAKCGMGYRKEVVSPEPKMESCPHCSGLLPVTTNIRFWSAKELYEFAAVKAESERIAELNREANKAHQAKCIEEQLAHLSATPVPSVDEEVA
jgi:hypothetical protein